MKFFVISALLIGGFVSNAQQPKSSLKAGDVIPFFEKTGYDGKLVSLQTVESELIVIDFWASWCGPCLKSLKSTLRPMYESYDRSQVDVIGISNDRQKSKWEKAIKSWDIPWSNILDDDQSLVRSFDVPAIPTYFIVDNTGTILASNVFSSDLPKTVKRLLKERNQ